jgi:glycosyltransferase involved in cell wall biosynthesis
MSLEFGLLVVLGFQCVFALVNLIFFVPLRRKNRSLPQVISRVSVLVPARNEAANLKRLLASLQLQDDPNFEVIVLDDHSSDDSLEVIRRFAREDSRIVALSGLDLPQDWLGKNHACFQLSQVASGEILIFTDADTCWTTDGVRLIREAFERTRADALSAWPEQACHDPLSRLIQPLQQWSLLTFLPMWFVPIRVFPLAVAANGQLLCFSKTMYQKIGGHARVRGSVIEDMSLARLVKRNGGKFVLLNAVGVVRTFMYSSFQETWAGYAKNAYPAFGANLLALFLVLAFNLVLYVLPWGLLVFRPNLETGLLVLLSLFPRFLADVVSGYGWRFFVFHPVSVLAFTCISIQSIYWYVTGRVEWKGRAYDLRPTSTPSVLRKTAELPRHKHPS